jgi:molybdopterin converting factor subunit 1
VLAFALMRVRILAFATARDALGQDETTCELAEGSTVAELSRILQAEYPPLSAIWSRLAIAVDGELARPETPLADDCEVALLPPVSGGAPPRRTSLVDAPIDTARLAEAASHPTCGAVVLFVGNVRDHHQRRPVVGITYDAYRAMASRKLEAIATDLERSHAGLRLRIAHRLGDLTVGETSVAIAAASPHRATAYEASREALERLKREVPIWKREHYADGKDRWREEEPLA